jgi:tetratricopeptide (TPR) repeat protein
MIFKDILNLAMIGAALSSAYAVAQESLDEGPITVLDQQVPVAEEGPPEPDSGEAGLDQQASLAQEFARYKELMASGLLDEAENAAKRIIELSIELSGPTSTETAKALSNLALIQHRSKDFDAAQQNFQSAVDIIEDNEDQLNAALVNPLKGLAAAQLESGRPDLAVRTYGRAVHVTHVNEGPHNLDQVDILESLAETQLRLGALDQAKNSQDMIYSLNLRHFDGSAMEIVPTLLRRARWQRRTGYIFDERATYRRIIRIIEDTEGKDDFTLIKPLMKLGESYFFVDTSESQSFQSTSVSSGEMYFKRAVRIAENHPKSDWETVAIAKLALGDYYNFRSDQGRARKTYRDTWALLSEEESRFDVRRQQLESIIALNEDPIPSYVGSATQSDLEEPDSQLQSGRVTMSYDINTRGRVSQLKLVEASPKEFEDIRRIIQRELRTRIFRPRFRDAQPIATENQVFTHTFYYRQADLDKLRLEENTDDT